MGDFVARLGRTETGKNAADFTLQVWDHLASGVDTTGWTWTELGHGAYLVNVPALGVRGGTYHVEHTATGSPWNQGACPPATDDHTKYLRASETASLSIVASMADATPLAWTGAADLYGASIANPMDVQLIGELTAGTPATWTPGTPDFTDGLPRKLRVNLADAGDGAGKFLRIDNGAGDVAHFPVAISVFEVLDAHNAFANYPAGGLVHIDTGASASLVSDIFAHDIDGATFQTRIGHIAYMRDLLACPAFESDASPVPFTLTSDGDLSALRLSIEYTSERTMEWITLYEWDGATWTQHVDFDSYGRLDKYGKLYMQIKSTSGAAAAQTLTLTPTDVPLANNVSLTLRIPSTVGGSTGSVGMFFDAQGWPVAYNGDYLLQPTTGDAAAIATAVLAAAVEGSMTFAEAQRIMLAVLAGRSNGGGTTSVAFRDQDNTKDRVAATVDANGNRTAIVVDGT